MMKLLFGGTAESTEVLEFLSQKIFLSRPLLFRIMDVI